uniref:Uncharacterized protein n=1 Tax=Oryza sativa subsp. japonica TaxID=39947 RepID=Q69KJ3_ORYSJ|nr:hypothetical protein [Oryza sativa Japonica Group]
MNVPIQSSQPIVSLFPSSRPQVGPLPLPPCSPSLLSLVHCGIAPASRLHMHTTCSTKCRARRSDMPSQAGWHAEPASIMYNAVCYPNPTCNTRTRESRTAPSRRLHPPPRPVAELERIRGGAPFNHVSIPIVPYRIFK